MHNPATAVQYEQEDLDAYEGDIFVGVVKGDWLHNLLGPISQPIDEFAYYESDVDDSHSMEAVIDALGAI